MDGEGKFFVTQSGKEETERTTEGNGKKHSISVLSNEKQTGDKQKNSLHFL